MLPQPLTHLSGFASLNKEYLAPQDTIHTLIKSTSHFHGILELTFAAPTPTRPIEDGLVVTGTEGWLSVSQVERPGGKGTALRVTIKALAQGDGKAMETETVIEEPTCGVLEELRSFCEALNGKDDGFGLGDPHAALADVAFIQAALNSDGKLINLAELVSLAN